MSENLLFLDFETASHADLPGSGLKRYLADPSTIVKCLTWRLEDMPAAELWECGDDMPERIVKHLAHGHPFVAHNAPFDFHIWNRVLRRMEDYTALPKLSITQVRCSAARARYNGLPGSLADACEAMRLPLQKDLDGKAVMLELAANPEWTPHSHPELHARLYKYALIDTDAMYGLWHATQPLPAREQAFFELDMKINARGFAVDVEGAEAMERMKAIAESQIDFELTLATAGKLGAATETAKLKQYLADFGADLDDTGRETLKKALDRPGLPDAIRHIIQLRLASSRAPKKSIAILRAHVDGRIQHSTVWHGALSGRSTARGAGGLQSLNFARPRPGRSAEQCEAYLDAAKRGDYAFLASPEHGPALAALADAQRALVMAKPGCLLVQADLSGIEARMAAWLANDEEKLSNYEKGIDGYKVAATHIYGVAYEDVTKDQRQIGKVSDLALSYGGGSGAFGHMAANYGLDVPDDQRTEIVWNWRASRPAFERWWAMLEYAVLIALDQPGKPVVVPVGRAECARVVFVRDDVALRMQLPSGRAISYHNARLSIQPGQSAPVAIYDKPEGYVETLDRKILSNNLTQGLARDYFWEVLVDAERVETVVHHVYDEPLLEVPETRAQERLAQLLERLRAGTPWAPGLPLDADGHVSQRWRK